MEETKSGISWWGLVIVLFLLFIVFGGGFGGFGGYGYGRRGFGDFACCGASGCEVERQGLITAAETNYRIIDQANATRATVEATAQATQTKIDFYAYQDLRDKLAESQRQNMMLQNQLYSDAKFNALQTQLSSIQCNMLRRPDVTGIGVSCPSAAILNGLGVNTLSGLNGCCGCGPSVA